MFKLRCVLFLLAVTLVETNLMSCPCHAKDESVGCAGEVKGLRVQIDAEVKLEEDIGQPFGSVFEAVDGNGRVIVGACLSDSYTMFGPAAERNRLHCFVIDNKSTPCAEVLPKPFPEIPASRLVVLAGRLFAVPRMRLSPQAVELEGAEWKVSSAAVELACENFGGAQEVDGQELLFSKQGVVYGDRVVFKPEKGFEAKYFYYYSEGVLIAFRYGDTDSGAKSLVRAYKWRPTQDAVVLEDAFASAELGIDYPLTFGTVGGRIVFALNSEPEVWALDGTFRRIFRGDARESWQAYCAMPFYDKLIIGQYPSGSLYETDGVSVVPFQTPLPMLTDWPREAQSIAVYRGELYAGLWPWGWVYRLRGSKWELAFRVVPQVPIRDEIAPYSKACERAGLINNHWGQRVNSLVVHDNSLFASSMNKGGDPRGSAFVDSVSAYGSVTRYTLPGSLGTKLTPGVPYALRIVVSERLAILTVDGAVVDVCRGDFSSVAELKGVSWGAGIGGKFRGVIQRQQGWLTVEGGDPKPLPSHK